MDFLLRYLKLKQNKSKIEIGISIFKPSWSKEEIGEFKKYLEQKRLKIIWEKKTVFSKSDVIALYKDIFSFSEDDLRFGLNWKEETINHLVSGESYCFLVEGRQTTDKLTKYKYFLRNKYGKITHPKIVLTPKEFNEKVIRNLIHTVDKDEIENILWLLFT